MTRQTPPHRTSSASETSSVTRQTPPHRTSSASETSSVSGNAASPNVERQRDVKREAANAASPNPERGHVTPAFRAAWWLPGAHLQTVWGQFTRPRTLVAFTREILAAPDGDELVLDHVAGRAGSPRLVLLHGLEGSSYSVYVQGMAALAAAAGARATVLNFRSCARDPGEVTRWLPNRRPRLYHSGETTDIDHVLRTLARREPDTPLLAIGVSLGGNVLLKWLGENPGQTLLRAAATISVPYDLAAGARHLESRLGRMYVRHFLPTLGAKTAWLAEHFPEVATRVDLERARRARDLLRLRRRRDRAAARLRRRRRLLRALELAPCRTARHDAHAVHQRRGRSLPAARGAAPRRAAGSGEPRAAGHAARRPRRLRRRRASAQARVLGRATGGGLAARSLPPALTRGRTAAAAHLKLTLRCGRTKTGYPQTCPPCPNRLRGQTPGARPRCVAPRGHGIARAAGG